jgi:tetratricopeptide (TPR) repeat protein
MAQDIALRMIVVRQVDEAKAIRDQLSKGASFCHLAKTKSIAPSRKHWGFSGVVKVDDVQSELQAIVRKMNPGQISDVTTLGRYYAIVKVISPQVPQLLDTAKQQMNEGKIQPAIASIRQVLKLENDNIQAYILLSVAQSETKSYDAAIQTLKQAQSHAPTEAQIMMLMGTVYTKAAFEIKKSTYSKEAIESFQQVTKLDEGYAPAAQLGLGHIYLTLLKQPQKAIPPLKTSLELAPQIPRTHEYLIQAYIETKNYPQAWQQMRYAQSLGFNFPKLLSQLHKTNKPSK